MCLLGACENETNFGTVFGSTSGTWSRPWLLAFLTSGPKNGTKNEPNLEPKADTNLDSRILTSRQRKPAKKITTSELLRQSLIHNCITQRRGTLDSKLGFLSFLTPAFRTSTWLTAQHHSGPSCRVRALTVAPGPCSCYVRALALASGSHSCHVRALIVASGSHSCHVRILMVESGSHSCHVRVHVRVRTPSGF